MRISDWSSDVCSSDLKSTMPSPTPAHRPAWRGWATMTEADKNGESLYPPMLSAEIRRVRQDSGLSHAGFDCLFVIHKTTVQRRETDRKSGGEGESGSERGDLCGCRLVKKKKKRK